MERLLILFLNVLLASFCSGQTSATCDCSSRKGKDSLIAEYLDKGEELPNMYNNPRWLTLSDSLISICPNIAEAYQHKAVPYLKNGEYEKAFALIDKAAELDPHTWISYRGFCKCIFTKDYAGAITDFQQAQRIFPVLMRWITVISFGKQCVIWNLKIIRKLKNILKKIY